MAHLPWTLSIHVRPVLVLILLLLVTTPWIASPAGAGEEEAPEARQSQTADTGFDPGIPSPAFSSDGPRVCFDEAHRNFHTLDGRYAGFAILLRRDGYEVQPSTRLFSAGTLQHCRVLVIANAMGPEEAGDPAFTPPEIEAVEKWIRAGGSLLLIADHAPFGAAASSLAEAFGVGMLNGWVKDPDHQDAESTGPYIIRFDRDSGLLGSHPILEGRGPEERVDSVVTFGGQALKTDGDEGVLIRFSSSARNVLDPDSPDPETETAVAGWAHAVALEHGRGRAVIVGEAALLTAQIIRGPEVEAAGMDELRVGLSRQDTGNMQFALNTVHWLTGLLEPPNRP